MPKLAYWYAPCFDADCYSKRTRGLREIQKQLADAEPGDFGKPRKVSVEYKNALDLLKECIGEGGCWHDQGDFNSE